MKLTMVSTSALLAFSACASAPIAPERLASSEAAIQSADAVGAGKLPQAALYLRLAEEELAQAQQFAKAGDKKRAALFLDRSNADAALALALVRQDEAKADAERANAAVLNLQGET